MAVFQEAEAAVDGEASVPVVAVEEVVVTDSGTTTALADEVEATDSAVIAPVMIASAATVLVNAAASATTLPAEVSVSTEAGLLAGVAQGVQMTGAGGAVRPRVTASAAALLVPQIGKITFTFQS